MYEAVEQYLRDSGVAAGRGAYAQAQEIGRTISICRRRIASLLGVGEPSRVVFTFNGTDSLNMALQGILRPADHVITTAAEHNSVLRPLRYLAEHRHIEVTRVPCDSAGYVSPDDIRSAMTANTRLIAIVHASNVTGVIQPIQQIAAIAAERQVFTLIDAAQSAGHLPIQMDKWHIDLLATSGHKGLLGLLGTGVLAMSAAAADQLQPLRQGGTGTESESDSQPLGMPDRFEAGNHNVPGLVGLERGSAYIEQRGFAAIQKHDQRLTQKLLDGLQSIPGLQLFGPATAENRLAVVSFHLASFDPQELATLLDAEYGIQVRSGLHCAPRLHQQLGTVARGGTVRASVGPFTTEDDVAALIDALQQLTS